MPQTQFLQHLKAETAKLREAGLYKPERVMTSPQQSVVETQGRKVINLCANNYLGLSNNPELVEAARAALPKYGFGLSSVRFICGTQDIHKELERELSTFLGTDDTILYSSCFDANGGVFETLFGEEDAIISDALNHASIIDGVRLSKAKRFRYANNDMADLEKQLKDASGSRFKVIVTDGVFSMDGIIANLPKICDLADRYGALVMVDDSHAVGFVGPHGKGTHEHHGVLGRIDILTGTLGKALGGASGGYTSGRKEIVEWLRQRSRPYLFSNSVAPVIVATSLAVLRMLGKSDELIKRVHSNSRHFRKGMEALGFKLVPGEHPIIPVMLGDAKLASQMAEKMLAEGVYVIGFSYPVVPMGQARIRTQISAAHTTEELDRAIAAFAKVGKELGVIR
ncbi:MAG TPA: glycine C-acetyltransferase [Bdellovibrionota bacterium]|nr:glycine C-acetyltransferase [Bdellovibrionota bacterium]